MHKKKTNYGPTKIKWQKIHDICELIRKIVNYGEQNNYNVLDLVKFINASSPFCK